MNLDLVEFYCHDLADQRPPYGTFLFNHPDHLLLQSTSGWRTYGIRKITTKKNVARIFIHLNRKEANSPLRAPFGSIEFYDVVGEAEVRKFVSFIEGNLIGLGVKRWCIKHYPEAYNPVASKLLKKTLIEFNFDYHEEITNIIQVGKIPFERKIAVAQRQKISKSQKQFSFHQAEKSELKKIYSFISRCRKKKGQTLSMTFLQLQKALKAFPENFLLFQVSHRKIAAAAIVVKIDSRVLYTFYYAHDKMYDKISPVVFLISGIYQYAQKHHFEMIDLGTSMKGKEVNKSLYQFKKSIGGNPSSKFVFQKTY